LSIHKLFTTRADLHRTVYTHAKVKAVELMLVDALVEANEYLGIALHAQDPADFWKVWYHCNFYYVCSFISCLLTSNISGNFS
jgi:hypothetical protein